jgi:hypothetical protein
VGGVAVEIDDRQQRGTSDARLRVGLHDLRDRDSNVEIGDACFVDELGQFARAKRAPPVERRNSALRRSRVTRPGAIDEWNI